MSAEIIGLNKILKHLQRYEFQKIRLSRGSEPVYLKRASESDTKETLLEDFSDWVNEFIEPDNFKEYKLELFGTNVPNKTNLELFSKVTVAFNNRANVIGTTSIAPVRQNEPSMDVDKYVSMAVELATVKAQNERLEEKIDELLEDYDNREDIGSNEPKNIGEAVQSAIIGKADKIIDALLIYFASSGNKQAQAPAMAINGVESDVLEEFKAIHPDIEEDLSRLLVLAKTKPDFFRMLITQLRSIV